MIEWLVISAAVKPFLKDCIETGAKKLGAGVGNQALAVAYKRLARNGKLTKANQLFVQRFSEELDRALDVPLFNAKYYEEALAMFLRHAPVQDVLLATLDGESPLDWQLLRGIWKESRSPAGDYLVSLPEEFDWLSLAKMFHKSLRREMIADPDLRPIVQALAEINTAEANREVAANVERLAGPVKIFDLERYSKSLRVAYAHLKLGSLDSDWTQYESGVRLEGVYIPQSAKQALPPRDFTRDYLKNLAKDSSHAREKSSLIESKIPSDQQSSYALLNAVPIMEIVDDPSVQRLVLLGDPGLGKSTLLKSLALRWASDVTRPLVLFIELRSASREAGFSTFLKYSEHGVIQTSSLPEIELDRYLKAHSVLALFDGLDEVPDRGRSACVADIIRFADTYTRAKVIVTTRVHGYYPGSNHPETFRDANFRQYTLQDFDPLQIDRFISLWHREAIRDVHDRQRYESRLRRALHSSPAIRELSGNPLLLTMMSILSRTQDLPRDRSKLYERCAELLLKNWDLEKFPDLNEKRDTRDFKDKLGPDQKMRILENVAETMQREHGGLGRNLIGQEKLHEVITGDLEHLGIPQPALVANDLIWMLGERNFMLAYLGDKQYAYIHRTFLEYFCARGIKFQFEKTTFLSKEELRDRFARSWQQDEWHEVFRLLCGMIGAEYASGCLQGLLSCRKQIDGYRAVLLASQCVQEVRELGSVREVRDDIYQALSDLCRQDFLLAFHAVHVRDELGQKVVSAVLQEIARGWKEQPEVADLLKRRALDYSYPLVSEIAVRELASAWRDSPDIFDWLKQLVKTETPSYVCQSAIQGLSRNFNGYPGLLDWLKRIAKRNPEPDIRAIAGLELARGWNQELDILEFLISVAKSDEDGHVREVTTRELLDRWKGDKRVQELNQLNRDELDM